MFRVTVLISLLLTAPAFAEDMTFQLAGNGGNCDDCEWIAATGEITSETPDLFTHFAEEHRTRRIIFDSPGGDLGAALRLGRMLREMGKTTGVGRTAPDDFGTYSKVIEGRCESACAFAYMGGTARRVDPPEANVFVPMIGRLGMHRFYTREGNEIPSAATQQIMGQLLIFVQDMGIDPRVLSLASTASEEQMYYFSQYELEQFRMVTTGSLGATRPAIVDDGLALQWERRDETQRIERQMQLHCDGTPDRWILTVTSLGADRSAREREFTTFQEDEEFYFNDIRMRMAGQDIEMHRSDILSVESNGSDYRMRAHIPIDPRQYPGEEFRLVTTTIRMAIPRYFATGAIPDTETLNVLSRVCLRS